MTDDVSRRQGKGIVALRPADRVAFVEGHVLPCGVVAGSVGVEWWGTSAMMGPTREALGVLVY
ncbi:MAG: hypothetical protein AAGA32_19895, partial [Pseudomonadota bacterium]